MIEHPVILKVLSGSYAHGTNLPTSDKDIRGICVPPIDYYFGLKEFEQYESKKESKENDIVIFGFKKYLNLAMKGNLSALNFLFCRKKEILYCDKWGQQLINNRELFLSHNVIDCILGYTKSQLHRMKNGSGRCGARKDIVDEHGFDTKFAYHAVLITDTAVELLKSGTYHVYRPDKEQKKLKDIRTGKFKYEEVMSMIEQNLTVIKTLEAVSRLPKHPDGNKINAFCVNFLTEYLFQNDSNYQASKSIGKIERFVLSTIERLS